jgi:hypothetical protein
MRRRLLVLAFLTSTLGMYSACAARTYMVAPGPPPAPRAVVVTRSPGAGFVWTDGYWSRRGNSWQWIAGSWVRPPRARAVWVPGRWVAVGKGYRFHPGYWR